MMDKKIKGYKVPYDMLSWGIKKGDLMVKSQEGQDYNVDGYLPLKLPAEIVETWEAVYEEEEKEFTKSDLRAAFYGARAKVSNPYSFHYNHKTRYESFEDYYATLQTQKDAAN